MKFLLILPLTASLMLSSCGVQKSPKNPNITGFLSGTRVDTTTRIERLPFEHAWRDPKLDITRYKHIVVRPVTLDYLKSNLWEESKSKAIPNRRAFQRRASALARHWDKSLKRAFSSPVCSFYLSSDTQQPGTLILEVALTEVRFQNIPPAKAQTASPVDGLIRALTGAPLCAFEARVRDASTQKWVSTAADRRSPEIKIVNTEKLTIAGPNESICDEWSQQLMQASNKELFPTVKRHWFSFN
jgi:Protein of unknown function (DUF3313)